MMLNRWETLFLVLLAVALSGVNNYFFYSHVERHGHKMGDRLEYIIKGEIEFCRKNRISGKRYRKNIETIVKNFSKERFYNASLILKHETKGELWKNPNLSTDGVVASYIEINIPKLKTHKKLGMTLCLKNLVGVTDPRYWLPHYTSKNKYYCDEYDYKKPVINLPKLIKICLL